MKTIKVIDLLNMLANKEFDKIPKRLMWRDHKIYLNDGKYVSDIDEIRGVEVAECWNYRMLNSELEIIEEDILDDKEREYLSNVIKPFRNKVNYVAKYRDNEYNQEWITISVAGEETIMFPFFPNGEMYKGMELEKGYTLEELGL